MDSLKSGGEPILRVNSHSSPVLLKNDTIIAVLTELRGDKLIEGGKHIAVIKTGA
jgi:hypothetical protein